jgi:pSer/pThr/pTyr-binding forkhead associated (FHA) protein
VFDRAGQSDTSGRSQFPVGWIIVVEGPGRGNAFTLKGGVMQIGRGAGQGVQLDFGDTAISRENHAAVAFDDETGKFFLGHGGKSNLVRLNGAPVLSTEELSNRDRIRIGETTLMFIGLCNEEFIWTSGEGSDDDA